MAATSSPTEAAKEKKTAASRSMEEEEDNPEDQGEQYIYPNQTNIYPLSGGEQREERRAILCTFPKEGEKKKEIKSSSKRVLARRILEDGVETIYPPPPSTPIPTGPTPWKRAQHLLKYIPTC